MFNLSEDDQEIINNLKMGGILRSKAETKLFNLFSRYVLQGVHSFPLTEDEAFSAYSDTIRRAIKAIVDGSFRGDSSLNTYTYKIFRNNCVDQVRIKSSKIRSVHHTQPIADLLNQIPDPAREALQILMAKNDQMELRRLINQLGENCRKILLMAKDGYLPEEIKIELNFKSTSVVKTTRLRCMKKLIEMYK